LLDIKKKKLKKIENSKTNSPKKMMLRRKLKNNQNKLIRLLLKLKQN
jgi:hypothetical protein